MNQQATAAADPLLTPDQVCEQLRISIWSLNKLRKDGDIDACKLGYRTVRYRQSDIDKFLAARPA